MTFLEFKNFVKDNKTGEIKLPDNNEDYKPTLQASLEYIANNIEPIDLLTDDVTKETLRWVNYNQLIRRPIATTTDEEKIDIDEQLTYSVAYHFLAMKTKDFTQKANFEAKRDEIINTYTWNNYKFLQSLGALK